MKGENPLHMPTEARVWGEVIRMEIGMRVVFEALQANACFTRSCSAKNSQRLSDVLS